MCTKYGGNAPRVWAKARRRLADEKAVRILQAEGVAAMTNPVPVLQRLAAEALALVGILRGMVAELDDFGCEGAGVGEQLGVEVGVYERGLDRAQNFALDLVRIGLDEMLTPSTRPHVAPRRPTKPSCRSPWFP